MHHPISHEQQFILTKILCFVAGFGCIILMLGECVRQFNVFLFFIRMTIHLRFYMRSAKSVIRVFFSMLFVFRNDWFK